MQSLPTVSKTLRIFNFAPLRLGEIKKTKIPFKISSEGDSKWAHLESNQAPTDYESVALTE